MNRELNLGAALVSLIDLGVVYRYDRTARRIVIEQRDRCVGVENLRSRGLEKTNHERFVILRKRVPKNLERDVLDRGRQAGIPEFPPRG